MPIRPKSASFTKKCRYQKSKI